MCNKGYIWEILIKAEQRQYTLINFDLKPEILAMWNHQFKYKKYKNNLYNSVY